MRKSALKLRRIKYTDISYDWVSWLNDKVVTKYSGKRFKRHTIKSQKIFLKNGYKPLRPCSLPWPVWGRILVN